MSLSNMHDSGERQSFTSGAVRDTASGKPRPDLISPHANLREGAWLAKGAEKYKERNWEAGIPISRCIASLVRHVEAYKLGLTDEDHMAAIRTNAGFILHYEEEIKGGGMDPAIDDMPKYAQRPDWETEDGREGNYDVIGGVPSDLETATQVEVARLYADGSDVTGRPITRPDRLSELIPTPTFYIAGPMRGYDGLNFPAFDAARDRGIALGFNIVSPADLDRGAGIDPATDPNVTGYENKLSSEELNVIVRRDVEVIMSLQPERSDGIAVLPGWEESTGARAEVALARWLGLRIVDAENFIGMRYVGNGHHNLVRRAPREEK